MVRSAQWRTSDRDKRDAGLKLSELPFALTEGWTGEGFLSLKGRIPVLYHFLKQLWPTEQTLV